MLLMNWNGKRVLVTGAGGFIGSHLTERLADSGAQVKALIHYNALGHRGWLQQSPHAAKIEFVMGDICDRDCVQDAIRGQEIVFHLAALIAIPYSYRAPESYVKTNVLGTLNALQAARDAGVARFIHTSTSEVYGTARYVPIDEAHPLQGQSPYAATKIGADKIAEAFHLSFQLPVVTVRPFNTFGPRQSCRAVVPTIIRQLLEGDRLRLGNTNPTRDLNYVDNTVDGFLLAAEADGSVGKTINLGSGREISIHDLASLVASSLGRKLVIQQEEQRQRPQASEVMRLLADNRAAATLLSWKPAVGLEEGIRRTIAWLKQNPEPDQKGSFRL